MIVNYGLKLTGDVHTNGAFTLSGNISTHSFTLAGNILCNTTVTNVDVPDYIGPYVVIPKSYEQSLQTKDKVTRNDVTVEKIPYSEVSNPKGGITVNIGG